MLAIPARTRRVPCPSLNSIQPRNQSITTSKPHIYCRPVAPPCGGWRAAALVCARVQDEQCPGSRQTLQGLPPELCGLPPELCVLRQALCGFTPELCVLRQALCGFTPELCVLQQGLCGLPPELRVLRQALCGLRSRLCSVHRCPCCTGEPRVRPDDPHRGTLPHHGNTVARCRSSRAMWANTRFAPTPAMAPTALHDADYRVPCGRTRGSPRHRLRRRRRCTMPIIACRVGEHEVRPDADDGALCYARTSAAHHQSANTRECTQIAQ
jgi:hypothetical protein